MYSIVQEPEERWSTFNKDNAKIFKDPNQSSRNENYNVWNLKKKTHEDKQLNEINSQLNIAKDKINKSEGIATEMTQNETQIEKRLKKKKIEHHWAVGQFQETQCMCHRSPAKKRTEAEKTREKIMVENFSNSIKTINSQTPDSTNSKLKKHE